MNRVIVGHTVFIARIRLYTVILLHFNLVGLNKDRCFAYKSAKVFSKERYLQRDLLKILDKGWQVLIPVNHFLASDCLFSNHSFV